MDVLWHAHKLPDGGAFKAGRGPSRLATDQRGVLGGRKTRRGTGGRLLRAAAGAHHCAGPASHLAIITLLSAAPATAAAATLAPQTAPMR
jgi:hypothetical protein